MAISSYIPSSRVSQAGVCTSTTRPASPYEGQMIYETDTNRVLVYDNTAWVMIADTDTPPGLQHIKTTTIGSGVGSVEVTGAFSSDFDTYRITIANIQVSSAGGLGFRIGTLSSNTYYGNLNYMLYTSTTLTVENYNATGQTYVGLTASVDDLISTSLDIFGPNLTKSTTLHGTYYGRGYTGQFGALIIDANARTSFTIFNSSGTMTGGTITVYGYRK